MPKIVKYWNTEMLKYWMLKCLNAEILKDWNVEMLKYLEIKVRLGMIKNQWVSNFCSSSLLKSFDGFGPLLDIVQKTNFCFFSLKIASPKEINRNAVCRTAWAQQGLLESLIISLLS